MYKCFCRDMFHKLKLSRTWKEGFEMIDFEEKPQHHFKGNTTLPHLNQGEECIMLWIDQTVQFSVGCILSSTVENEQRERADIQFTFRLTIHFWQSHKYISAHITTTGNDTAHPRQCCALPGKEWGTIRGNDGPGRAIFFSLSADPIPPPAGQSGWAPGYENTIFIPKLKFTIAEGFVQ